MNFIFLGESVINNIDSYLYSIGNAIDLNSFFIFIAVAVMSDNNYSLESFTVESSDGVKLRTRVFKPRTQGNGNLGIVLVHPYSILGGSQGLLRGIASGLALNGYTSATFDMRGVGKSTGRPSLTGFAEVKDVVAVCNWLSNTLSLPRILLVGSSAGIVSHLSDQICQIHHPPPFSIFSS